MTNILVVFDHWEATRFESDHWHTANWFFGTSSKFLKAIATMAVIQPTTQSDEDHVKILYETASTLIGYRNDDQDETHPAPAIDSFQREDVVKYLIECNKAMRPYLPNYGKIELHSYVTSPEYNELYLIIKHYGDQEHPDTASAVAGIRAITSTD